MYNHFRKQDETLGRLSKFSLVPYLHVHLAAHVRSCSNSAIRLDEPNRIVGSVTLASRRLHPFGSHEPAAAGAVSGDAEVSEPCAKLRNEDKLG